MIHYIAHLFGWNTGIVVTKFDDKDRCIWVGFQCDRCGKITDTHKTNI